MTDPNTPGVGDVVLDHSGHFVADAQAARAALEDLGFTVTPYSAQVQPDPETGEPNLTGTGNICVMLPEGYLEFLVHTADTPIGLEFRAALQRRAGLHLAAFGVADAAAWHTTLQAAGQEMRPLVHFSREIATATGQARVAFTVARLPAGAMPEGRVQILTHHDVPNMWQPRWTAHPNGARALTAMIVSAPDPHEAADRFGRFLDRRPKPCGGGFHLALTRGALEILPEDEAIALAGIAVEPGRACFIGLRVSVADVAPFAARAGARQLDTGAVALPFGPALGPGTWLFDPARD